MFKYFLVVVFLIPLSLFGDYSSDTNRDGIIDTWVKEKGEEGIEIHSDTNFDGKPDTALHLNSSKISVYEESDYNLDGTMDNFYFYEYGYIVRQEIDSNYDGEVDIWVFITDKGKNITRYEKDIDFDGIVDKIKDFEVVDNG